MERSHLKIKASKTRSAKDLSNYKKHGKYMVKLNNECKKNHFDRLNPEKDSKPFRKSCKPYFSNKHSFVELKITLSENSDFLNKNDQIEKTLYSFFETVNVSDDKVQRIILNFSNHPSILKIKENFNLAVDFLSSMFLRLLQEN